MTVLNFTPAAPLKMGNNDTFQVQMFGTTRRCNVPLNVEATITGWLMKS